MERLWRHVQCSIPAEVIIMRIAAGLIPMPKPPSFDDKESDYEDLRDELCNLPEDLWCRHIQLPKPQRVFEHLKVQIISSSTFSRPKSSYVQLYKYPCLPCNIIRETFQIPIKEGPLP